MPALLIRTSSSDSSAKAAATDAESVTSSAIDPRARLAGGVGLVGVAHARIDGVAGGDEAAGGFEAEAPVCSGDQCGCHGSTLRPDRAAWVALPVPPAAPARHGMLGWWTSSLTCSGPGGIASPPRRWAFRPGRDDGPPGLRREELAMLAGVSVEYLVRLEQGRARHPSPQLLGALARALRLTDDERDHLYPGRRCGRAVGRAPFRSTSHPACNG